jgi:hypothetical protein
MITLFPLSASAAATFAVSSDFPTPPFETAKVSDFI